MDPLKPFYPSVLFQTSSKGNKSAAATARKAFASMSSPINNRLNEETLQSIERMGRTSDDDENINGYLNIFFTF